METDPRIWITALRQSHERLAALTAKLAPGQLRAQSYCRDWTNAQVLSHVGSGAEIALMMLPGALGDTELVSTDAFRPVWDTWNAKSPDEQAADALPADERYVQALEQLSDEQLTAIRLPFHGLELDAVGVVRLRLSEHAMHTWDIAVYTDPAATVAADAAGLLVDNVPVFLAPRLGKPPERPYRARIRVSHPARDYLLTTGEAVAMTDWPGDGDSADANGASRPDRASSPEAAGRTAEVSMSAEALLRLMYGRLDAGHTPAAVVADAGDLDKLREIFPGF